MVVSLDVDAKSELSGENWSAQTLPACPVNRCVCFLVRTSQTSQEAPLTRKPEAAARSDESGEKASDVKIGDGLDPIDHCYVQFYASQTVRPSLVEDAASFPSAVTAKATISPR